MVAQFPTPYPDELLYSVFARYKVRAGIISPKVVMRDLFSRKSATAIIDLPCGIDAVLENIITPHDFTAQELIFGHTLYPYYRLGAFGEKIEQVFRTMRGNKGGDIHTTLGIMASTIPVSNGLKYCPVCFKEDKLKYGEAYWHRIHQVPGVLICPYHGQILGVIVDPYLGRFNKHEFHEANETNCRDITFSVKYNHQTIENLYKLARQAEWIINSKFPHNEPDWYREQYINLLINKNLASPNGRVAQKEFRKEFTHHFGKEFLFAIGCSIDPANPQNWLASIVRKSNSAFHPLHHTLIMIYLAGNVSAFLSCHFLYQPFGIAPWPCLNAAANHYKQLVINDVEITYDCKSKRVVGTFSCTCGFIYCRSGPDSSEKDRFRIGRIKAFGLVWLNKLQELLTDHRLSMREISRILHVDVNTVIKYQDSLNKNATSPSSKKGNDSVAKIITEEERKAEWVKYQMLYPELTKTQLREKLPKVYAWLYRNCKEWLIKNSPKCVSKCNSNNRTNWSERDNAILVQLKTIVKDMLRFDTRPERITISRLGKKGKCLSILEKHIDKIPKSKEFIDSVIEDQDAFCIRKLNWAAKQLAEIGEVKEWRLRRMAGVGNNCSPKTNKKIQDLISNYPSRKKLINGIL